MNMHPMFQGLQTGFTRVGRTRTIVSLKVTSVVQGLGNGDYKILKEFFILFFIAVLLNLQTKHKHWEVWECHAKKHP